MVSFQIQTNRFTRWWVHLPACRGSREWDAGSPRDFARDSREPLEDKEAKAREMMTANLAVATRTESGIGIHTDGGTEIEKEPENTEKGQLNGAKWFLWTKKSTEVMR